jgi:quercetin dioxygenase-like cupin family protein
MRQLVPIILTVVLVTCGGAPPPAASSASATPPAATPSASAAPSAAASSASATAIATSAHGVTSTVFAVGQFHEIGALSTAYSGSWQAQVNTKGESDVWILENKVAPGGSFGWHSHPGPSLVVVKTGALTLYRANDPSCTPQIVEAGSGFVDAGGDVHIVRNEGSIEAVVYVMSFVPRGGARKIDQPQPGNCPSIQ